MPSNDTVLSRLKELREQHGWSQSELATRSGLSRSEVNGTASQGGIPRAGGDTRSSGGA